MEIVALVGSIVGLVTASVNLFISLREIKRKDHRSDKR